MINEELKIAILDYKEKEVIQKGKVKYFITPIKPNCAIKAKENFEKKTPEQQKQPQKEIKNIKI